MFKYNSKTIEAKTQRHVGTFMLILLLLSSLVSLSRFLFDMYFATATFFFSIVLFILLYFFVLSI